MAEDWQVEPGVGFGPVKLGMSPADVLALFGEPGSARGDPTIPTGTTWLYTNGPHIGFDADDRVVEIQAIRGCDVRAMFEGVNLLGRSGPPAVEALRRADPATRPIESGFGFEAPNLHIGVWQDDDERSAWDTAIVSDAAWVAFHEQRRRNGTRRSQFEGIDRPAVTARPWAIRTGHSVGPIRVGMRRGQVDRILGTPSRAYSRPDRKILGYDAVDVELAHDGVLDPDGTVATVNIRLWNGDLQHPRLKLGRLTIDGSEDLVERLARAGHQVEPADYGRLMVDGTIRIEGAGMTQLRSVRIDLVPRIDPD